MRTRLRSAEIAILFDATKENELYTRAYVQGWVQGSGLLMLQPRTIKCPWDFGGALALTMFFFNGLCSNPYVTE